MGLSCGQLLASGVQRGGPVEPVSPVLLHLRVNELQTGAEQLHGRGLTRRLQRSETAALLARPVRRLRPLHRVAGYAGREDICPRGRAAGRPRNDVVKRQVLAVEPVAAVLAPVTIP
jgi:hypothetical protein